MASSILYSNFTAGLVTPKVAGQYNSTAYHNGCSVLQNFSIMLQGGLTRRPGTGPVAEAVGTRLIPFLYSTELCFLFELYAGHARIWKSDRNEACGLSVHSVVDLPYTADQISQVRYTQTYDTLILVHPEVSPYFVKYEDDNFIMSHIEPKVTRDENNLIYDENDIGLFTEKDYPSETFYYAGRLWFACSKEHPFKLWASRAFEIDNFEFKDRVEVEDEVTTTQSIIDSIKNGDDEYDVETVTRNEYVVREDSALQLEVGASRNDRILWMSSMGSNIIVGTASGEWIMNGAINGLTQSIFQVSSYGSAGVRPVSAGSDTIFVQMGGKRVRSYVGASDGYSSPDMSYACDELLSRGVVAMAWRRIPEPTLYCVLSDGTLAVLFYDRLYGLQGWSEWTFAGQVEDVCVIDTEEGQRTFIMIQRGDKTYIEYFRDVDPLDSAGYVYVDRLGDQDIQYVSRMTTNPYERTSSTDGSSLGKKKRFYSIVLRVLNTKAFEAGYEDGYFKSFTGDAGQDDIEILLPGGFSKRVSMTVMSIGDKALTMLGMAIVTEVN